MKQKYTLEDVKLLIERDDFDELNRVIKKIKESSNRDIEDIRVLEYLSNNNKISEESREELSKLKDEYIEEIKLLEETPNEEEIKAESGVATDVVEDVAIGAAVSQLKENEEEPENFDITNMKEDFLKNRLEEKGLTVKEINDPTTKQPSITFEINYESKAYIDNLMLMLHKNNELGLNFSLTKIDASNEELFTVSINTSDLTIDDIIKENERMLNAVESIVSQTDKDKKNEYEEMMPDGLRALKEPFNNDAPDIPKGNFKITCVNSEGISKYYIMASSKETAEQLTERIGFKSADYLGSGIIELDTNGKNMDDTKLMYASETANVATSNDIDRVNQYENAKEKTLGTMPVKPSTNSAFTNIGNILLVILLVILVILVVTMMVIK